MRLRDWVVLSAPFLMVILIGGLMILVGIYVVLTGGNAIVAFIAFALGSVFIYLPTKMLYRIISDIRGGKDDE